MNRLTVILTIWFLVSFGAGCNRGASPQGIKGFTGDFAGLSLDAETTGLNEAQPKPNTNCSELAREREGLLRSVEDIERRIGKGHTRFERDGMLYHAKCNRMVLRIRMIEKQMKDLNCPSNSE
jgi:hypothetical protein